jgi:hypothetical protein
MAETKEKEASIVAAIKAQNIDDIRTFLDNGELVVSASVSL